MSAQSVLPGQKALVMHASDNVAVAIQDIAAGEEITVTKEGAVSPLRIQLRQAVPFGHKLALEDIPIHGSVRKYGEQIGLATAAIQVGEHVHVHNVESTRARGDKQAG